MKKISILFLSLFVLAACSSDDDTGGEAKSDAKEIVSYTFRAVDNDELDEDVKGVIDKEKKTIKAELPSGTNLEKLKVEIIVSDNAETGGINRKIVSDFTIEDEITVTAENGSKQKYSITITAMLSERDALIAIYRSNPNNALGWNLEEDDLSKWEGIALGEDGSVVGLALFSKGIRVLPKEIEVLNNLENLTVFNDVLVEIPEELGSLSNLKQLNFSRNELSELPEQLGQLGQCLESLSISGNQFTKVPNCIFKLTKLQNLLLASNEIDNIPTEIINLTNLEFLDVGDNKIPSLPDQIADLTKLDTFLAYQNLLTAIPNWFGNLSSLTSISFTENKLETFPNIIFSLDQLELLYLNDCGLTDLPNEIGDLSNLVDLTLEGNLLGSLPAELGTLSKLEFLNITGNRIRSLPDELGNLESLKRLWIAGNQLPDFIPIPICQLIEKNEVDLKKDPFMFCDVSQ